MYQLNRTTRTKTRTRTKTYTNQTTTTCQARNITNNKQNTNAKAYRSENTIYATRAIQRRTGARNGTGKDNRRPRCTTTTDYLPVEPQALGNGRRVGLTESSAAETSGRDLLWQSFSTAIRANKGRVALSMMSLMVVTTIILAQPLLSGTFFQSLLGSPVGNPVLRKVVLALLVTYSVEPVCTFCYVTSMSRIIQAFISDLQQRVFALILGQNTAFFDLNSTPQLMSILSTEIDCINNVLGSNLSRDRGFRSVFEALGDVIILVIIARPLAPLLIAFTTLTSVMAALFSRRTIGIFAKRQIFETKMKGTASNAFSNIKTIRAFAAERFEFSYFSSMLQKANALGSELGKGKALLEGASRFAIYASLFSLYSYGGYLVNTGVMPVKSLLSGIGFTFSLVFATQGLTNTFADLVKAMSSMKRLSSFIDDLQPMCTTSDEAILQTFENQLGQPGQHDPHGDNKYSEQDLPQKNATKSGNALTMHVDSFSYPARPDMVALKDVEIVLKPNTVTALVGPSGAGKSTIVQLLCRFYNLDGGWLSYLDENAQKFSRREWSQVVSLVSQEPVLFPGSVRDNIVYGMDAADEDQVISAAKAANAHGFIMQLPEGYDTEVGDKGSRLSGGQKQRIAIARAFIRDTPILLLDEATSALDAESERLVQDALEKLFSSKAVLVIAHRLSTVVNADEIIVVDKGSILDRGKHDQLLSRNAMYQKLIGAQQINV